MLKMEWESVAYIPVCISLASKLVHAPCRRPEDASSCMLSEDRGRGC